MTIGQRIKERRKQAGLSVDELADRLGKNRATIYRYESDDIKKLPVDMLEPIAKALGVTPADLLSCTENQKIGKTTIPVLGRVAAGIPIEAVEDVIDYEEIAEAMARDGEYFALKIKGDSMEPRMKDGDVVIVRKQNDAYDGDIVIATVNGDDATCKVLKKYENGDVALLSLNPSYQPFYFSKQEVKDTPIQIWGKVKELRAKF